MLGKRTPDETRGAWRNMARPTGFMFSMAKGKKSDEEGPEFFDDEQVSILLIRPKKLDHFILKIIYCFGKTVLGTYKV